MYTRWNVTNYKIWTAIIPTASVVVFIWKSSNKTCLNTGKMPFRRFWVPADICLGQRTKILWCPWFLINSNNLDTRTSCWLSLEIIPADFVQLLFRLLSGSDQPRPQINSFRYRWVQEFSKVAYICIWIWDTRYERTANRITHPMSWVSELCL